MHDAHTRRPPVSPVRRALASIGRYPRKRLGQHFLADGAIAQRIVDLAQLRGVERVVEIGPGLGALSDILVHTARELWLIEVDRHLASRLQSKYADQPHVHVVEADVLAVDFDALLGERPFSPRRPPSTGLRAGFETPPKEGGSSGRTEKSSPSDSKTVRAEEAPSIQGPSRSPVRESIAAPLGTPERAVVVASLPYNIATAVLAALLAPPQRFSRLVLMLQREVVDRLRAQPGGKEYAALSVLTQFAARLRPGIRIGPEAFVPRPKVESEVIIVEPYDRPPVDVAHPEMLARVVRTVFNQRRKQLANSLRPLCTHAAATLREAGIDPTRRPETLTLAEFATLSDVLTETPDGQTTDDQTTDNRRSDN